MFVVTFDLRLYLLLQNFNIYIYIYIYINFLAVGYQSESDHLIKSFTKSAFVERDLIFSNPGFINCFSVL